jgi:hypothetical protein
MFRLTKHQQNNRKLNKFQELIHEACCQIIHELADIIGISYEVCQEILIENLNMPRIATNFVSRFFTNDQKQRWPNVSRAARES